MFKYDVPIDKWFTGPSVFHVPDPRVRGFMLSLDGHLIYVSTEDETGTPQADCYVYVVIKNTNLLCMDICAYIR